MTVLILGLIVVVLAVACLAVPALASGKAVFGTSGHLSTEWKPLVLLGVTLVTSLWVGLLAPVADPAEYGLRQAVVVHLIWALTVYGCVYAAGRSVIKIIKLLRGE